MYFIVIDTHDYMQIYRGFIFVFSFQMEAILQNGENGRIVYLWFKCRNVAEHNCRLRNSSTFWLVKKMGDESPSPFAI